MRSHFPVSIAGTPLGGAVAVGSRCCLFLSCPAPACLAVGRSSHTGVRLDGDLDAGEGSTGDDISLTAVD
ncbi:hypothetical protein BRC86_01310 [Halobacteriales archaeon QS_3_64_16]|nr:MAG: hypothetical protein BRC86_01310 [Halobacteriales archaeon QS_3_64_16]